MRLWGAAWGGLLRFGRVIGLRVLGFRAKEAGLHIKQLGLALHDWENKGLLALCARIFWVQGSIRDPVRPQPDEKSEILKSYGIITVS